MSSSSTANFRTLTIAGVGVVVTGVVAYAFYFDYKRRNDADFRKALKRESKKQARAAKEEAEAGAVEQRKSIHEAVDRVNEDGFPKEDPEEVEGYFMNEVSRGEQLSQDGAYPRLTPDTGSSQLDAALCFYKALKVYPNPSELVTIYDKTVPKPILDILAEMIAYDKSIPIGKSAAKPDPNVE
ncbi:mitochondrial outer membrane translocase complex, subunit Tom20 domain-containing protein [Phyllosticta citriasiana]|uniref:Mitochondrial outer membrane translocase complex, subunit Tom20 domain-containing protein n=1 Tax=Phyllosticta citriasiana TaxID=595635 RepID=A0ABR1KA14_9PEZI